MNKESSVILIQNGLKNPVSNCNCRISFRDLTLRLIWPKLESRFSQYVQVTVNLIFWPGSQVTNHILQSFWFEKKLPATVWHTVLGEIWNIQHGACHVVLKHDKNLYLARAKTQMFSRKWDESLANLGSLRTIFIVRYIYSRRVPK